MTTKLTNLSIKEISLVKKGANGKRIYLTKAQDSDQMDTQEIEKALKDAADAKVALEKAEADRKTAEDKIAALEKAAADAAAATATERAALEKAAVDAAAKAVELEKALEIEKEAKAVSEAVQKAAVAYKHLPETPEVLGPLLRTIRKADAAVADKVEALLAKVDTIAKSALDPRGTARGGDASATALDEIRKRAEALVKAGKVDSIAKGFDEVLRADKDLYTRYEAERASK
jgi:hypothetical protein